MLTNYVLLTRIRQSKHHRTTDHQYPVIKMIHYIETTLVLDWQRISWADNRHCNGYQLCSSSRRLFPLFEWSKLHTGTSQRKRIESTDNLIFLFASVHISYWVRVMVFNATFNNISAISWWSVLLVEETGVTGENHRHSTSHWQTLSHKVVWPERDSNSQLYWWRIILGVTDRSTVTLPSPIYISYILSSQRKHECC